jgi:ubiquinone/menaquinone biosynthesis C-methylase UbiE
VRSSVQQAPLRVLKPQRPPKPGVPYILDRVPPANDLEHSRYARMRWNTPLSDEHARLLLSRLDIRAGASLLDLGCGWGELLLRAVDSTGVTSGIGVDTDPEALARGRSLAADRGLDGRVTFVVGSADAWQQPADRVICVGAAHAWGSAEAALTAAIRLVQPGGRLLFGDGCWERSPNEDAAKLFGDAVLTLSELVKCVQKAKWRILHLSTADQREWDDFESTWRAGRQEWLLANPEVERAPAVRNELDLQLGQYVDTYRGVLGFCYLVLGR